jgi:hypothetical protein
MNKERTRLKPVVYSTDRYNRGAQNTAQQMFLLKALKITQDPKKLRDMLGVKSVAEVYRTLDKLAMRKEYHAALAKAGISFDYIAGGIKKIADGGTKDSDKLNALKTLLKSVGMDEYKEESTAMTGTWEELLLKKIEENKDSGKPALGSATPTKYEVKQPVIPESARKAQEEEREMTSSIYDSPAK